MKNARMWLFRFMALVLVPAAVFMVVEAGLRIAGYGYPTDFTVECNLKSGAYCENGKFSRLFFPGKIARPPIPFVMQKNKPDDTYRIFILGGSAAQGDPAHSFGMGRMLEVMLNEQYPEMNFEVINTAMTAINSHVVYRIGRDMARRQGDLFIIYLGNNEVVGPYGAGTVLTESSPDAAMVRVRTALKTSRIVQLFERLFRMIVFGTHGEREEWGGMEMFLGKQLRASDPALKGVYRNFEKNISDIMDAAVRSGAKVIISSVGVNLRDSAPFASLHRSDISEQEKNEWERIYKKGVAYESSGMYDEAIESYLDAGRIDGSYAELQYRLGRSYEGAGNYAEARRRFDLARDYDALRFRADTRINDIIKSEAERRTGGEVHFLDAAGIFRKNSPHETTGSELFYDHVHMNFRGNYILAKNISAMMDDVLPVCVTGSGGGGEPMSENEVAGRLAFTDYDRMETLAEMISRFGNPPFTNQLGHEERLAGIKQRYNSIGSRLYDEGTESVDVMYLKAIRADEPDPWLRFNYAEFLNERGRHAAAVEQLRVYTEYMPQDYNAYEMTAAALLKQGRYERAVEQCDTALRINPDFSKARYTRAFALAALGEYDKSIAEYEKLLETDPGNSVDIYNEMGRIRINKGDLPAAAESFRKAVKYHEESGADTAIPDVHFNLGYTLKKMGMHAEAGKQIDRAVIGYYEKLEDSPDSAATHAVLGRVLAENRSFERAAVHYRKAVRLAPGSFDYRMRLIRFEAALGRPDEAAAAAEEALRYMEEAGREREAAELRDILGELKQGALEQGAEVN